MDTKPSKKYLDNKNSQTENSFSTVVNECNKKFDASTMLQEKFDNCQVSIS